MEIGKSHATQKWTLSPRFRRDLRPKDLATTDKALEDGGMPRLFATGRSAKMRWSGQATITVSDGLDDRDIAVTPPPASPEDPPLFNLICSIGNQLLAFFWFTIK